MIDISRTVDAVSYQSHGSAWTCTYRNSGASARVIYRISAWTFLWVRLRLFGHGVAGRRMAIAGQLAVGGSIRHVAGTLHERAVQKVGVREEAIGRVEQVRGFKGRLEQVVAGVGKGREVEEVRIAWIQAVWSCS